MDKHKCPVKGCRNEAFYFRICSPEMKNGRAVNGYLCKEHYEKLLDIALLIAGFSLRKKP